ncbi:alpha/beta hydrolase [Streptomyces sp. NPDC050560]|uniref:alpha/beta hydrolase n=1 Tax=Streptomyces sp. NPDC050560 TaxID=3365630 RepID=UPI0037B48F26
MSERATHHRHRRLRLRARRAALVPVVCAVALATTVSCTAEAGTHPVGGIGGIGHSPAADSPAPDGARRLTGRLADGATWVADVPAHWKGTLLLFSHGLGALKAKDARNAETRALLLKRGYAMVGSSYDPHGSPWALRSAERDQLAALDAFSAASHRAPRRTLAVGESMGGLVTARIAQDGAGHGISGAVDFCGAVAGGPVLGDYQLNGAYAAARLLLPDGGRPPLQGFGSDAAARRAGAVLDRAVGAAQSTAAGRARTALVASLLNLPGWTSGQAPPAADDYAGQEAQQAESFTRAHGRFAAVQGIRRSLEQSAGGAVSGNTGVDYSRLEAGSPQRAEVAALYRKAGLDLAKDLADLTRHADQKPDPAAARSLRSTSSPGSKLSVPLLDVHTEADPVIAAQQETPFGTRMAQAGDAALLRQAYVHRAGHLNILPAEQVAAIDAVNHRVATGSWSRAGTAALQKAAKAVDPKAAFHPFGPGALVVAPG